MARQKTEAEKKAEERFERGFLICMMALHLSMLIVGSQYNGNTCSPLTSDNPNFSSQVTLYTNETKCKLEASEYMNECQITYRSNIIHHHFYSHEVDRQVPNDQGVLGSLVPSILDMGLAC